MSNFTPSSLPSGTVIRDSRGRLYLQTSTGIRRLDRSTALAILNRDATRARQQRRLTRLVVFTAAAVSLAALLAAFGIAL